jgi:uncharacterized membrane protein
MKMTKNEFIGVLNSQLSGTTEDERKDMLYDYEEHFRFAKEEGKSEEKICEELGDPKEIVKQYNINYKVQRAEENPSTRNILSAVLAGLSLGFFNLIMVIPVYLGLIAVLLGLFSIAVSFALVGIALIFSPVLVALVPQGYVNVGMNTAAAIFFGIGFAALGTLFFIGDCYVVKYFYKLTIKYLRWNVNIIKNSDVKGI